MTSHPPPSPNWADGSHSTRAASPNALAMMFIGAIIFAVGCGSGLVAGWFAGAATGFGSLLDDFAAADTQTALTLPGNAVSVGEPFDITLHLTEVAGETRTIYSIDLWTDEPETLKLVSTSPPPTERGGTEPNWNELFFDITLGPHESSDVVFTLQATTPGVHAGEFEVYYNETLSQTVRFSIEAATAD